MAEPHQGWPSSGKRNKVVQNDAQEDENTEQATEPLLTRRGQAAQHKSVKARNNPQLLPMLVQKQHPDMKFGACKCELTGGQTVVGFAEYSGELYLKLGAGLLEEDEVLSMAHDVVGKLMGLEHRGPRPQRDPRNDKRIVIKHMRGGVTLQTITSGPRDLINGDGAVADAITDPPGLRDYIQQRRKELWLGEKKPRISAFHARALIEEFTDPDKKFDWAGLKVGSLAKVMTHWGANANGGTTTNKEFLCEYVALALALKDKWQEQQQQQHQLLLKAQEEQRNTLNSDKGKKRKQPSRAARGGAAEKALQLGKKRVTDDRMACLVPCLAETSLAGELRNPRVPGDQEGANRAGPGMNPTAAGTPGARNSKQKRSPPSARGNVNPEELSKAGDANRGSPPMPVAIAREVPNGGVGAAAEEAVPVPVDLASRKEKREELLEEIANTKDLQAFAVLHFKNTLRQLYLELDKLGPEESPPKGPPKIWNVAL